MTCGCNLLLIRLYFRFLLFRPEMVYSPAYGPYSWLSTVVGARVIARLCRGRGEGRRELDSCLLLPALRTHRRSTGGPAATSRRLLRHELTVGVTSAKSLDFLPPATVSVAAARGKRGHSAV